MENLARVALAALCIGSGALVHLGNATEPADRLFAEGFDVASRVTTDSSGRVYVVDRANSRIVVFSRDGALLRQVGQPVRGPMTFEPLDAAVSGDGRTLAVLDSGNRRVQIFSAAGSRVGGFRIVPPTHEGQRDCPWPRWYRSLNQPALGNVVSVYSRSGKAMKAFGSLCPPGWATLIGERIGFPNTS